MARRRKGRKDAIIALLFPIFYPVIPAKAGSQRVGNSLAPKRMPAAMLNANAVLPTPPLKSITLTRLALAVSV